MKKFALILIACLAAACGSDKDNDKDHTAAPGTGDAGAETFFGLWAVNSIKESSSGCDEATGDAFDIFKFVNIYPNSKIIPRAAGYSFRTCDSQDDCAQDTLAFNDWTLEKVEGGKFIGVDIATSHGGDSKECQVSFYDTTAALQDDGTMLVENRRYSGTFTFTNEDDCSPRSESLKAKRSEYACDRLKVLRAARP